MARTAKLLVSVRSSEETIAAISGGAEIVDIKEPEHGPLGCAAAETIDQIASVLSLQDSCRPLSVALGELRDWSNMLAGKQQLLRCLENAQPAFLKMGLYDAVRPGSDWRSSLDRVRHELPSTARWVAVAYADHQQSRSPTAFDVAQYAIESGCAVLLIDTYRKDGTNLCNWLRPEQMQELRTVTSRASVRLALAGKVTVADLPHLLAANPDIIAVRGAVCQDGERNRSVCEDRVRCFRQSLALASGFTTDERLGEIH
ncbi:MAG: (5-formylfuran-3-yl)methyl phosphate synthase [Planctomycetota bacterium]